MTYTFWPSFDSSIFNLNTVDGLILMGYQFSWFRGGSLPQISVPTEFSVWIIKEITLTTNFEPLESLIFLQSTKIATHENKNFHSMRSAIITSFRSDLSHPDLAYEIVESVIRLMHSRVPGGLICSVWRQHEWEVLLSYISWDVCICFHLIKNNGYDYRNFLQTVSDHAQSEGK